jgi:peptidoglycan/LPS O-acetylase OafA/YrhL
MKRIQILDYARFVAAMFVLLFHYTNNGISNGKITAISIVPDIAGITRFGYLGVHLFFIISGYVIFYSAFNKSAAQFAYSRAKRLFPLFWIAVISTYLFQKFFSNSDLLSANMNQFLANLTMIPGVFGQKNMDGVYWSLVYELKFYLLIFVLLMFGKRSHLHYYSIAWILYVILVSNLHLHVYFAHVNYLFFSAGIIFAIIRCNTQINKYILWVLLAVIYLSIINNCL